MDVVTPLRIVIDGGSAASKALAILLRHEPDDIKYCSQIFKIYFSEHILVFYYEHECSV
jgi:hypothetical protein